MALHALAEQAPDRVSILELELNDPAAVNGFATALKGRVLDIALINAGVSDPEHRSALVV